MRKRIPVYVPGDDVLVWEGGKVAVKHIVSALPESEVAADEVKKLEEVTSQELGSFPVKGTTLGQSVKDIRKAIREFHKRQA